MTLQLKPWQASLIGGIVAGALDISYAFVAWGLRGIGPGSILQSVASGLLGRRAYEGGAATAALGGALHFAMTICMASAFMLAARRTPLGRMSPYLTGPAYGVVIYIFMNRVLLPLSAFPHETELRMLDLAVHMVFVGLLIALMTQWALSPSAGSIRRSVA